MLALAALIDYISSAFLFLCLSWLALAARDLLNLELLVFEAAMIMVWLK